MTHRIVNMRSRSLNRAGSYRLIVVSPGNPPGGNQPYCNDARRCGDHE